MSVFFFFVCYFLGKNDCTFNLFIYYKEDEEEVEWATVTFEFGSSYEGSFGNVKKYNGRFGKSGGKMGECLKKPLARLLACC